MKIFSFVKKVFVLGLTVLSSITNALEYISMKNQECKVRPKIVDINSNNPIFYPFSVKINKCSGKCNNINDPYARICVPDTVKNLNVKVFNLMTLNNETRSIKWHKSCKCMCSLNRIICNNKQRWNKEKCRCECKKLIDKGVCEKGNIFNPSNCKCECDKSCNISQYLDYSGCKCKKKLGDLLIEECTENIDETKLVNVTITKNNNETRLVNITITESNNETKLVNITITKNNDETKLVSITIAENNNETKLVNITIGKNENSHCSSCKVYIRLMIVAIVTSTGVTTYFVYYNWSFIRNKVFCIKSNAHKETLIY